jgi:ABC-type transport system substrate-binding protein
VRQAHRAADARERTRARSERPAPERHRSSVWALVAAPAAALALAVAGCTASPPPPIESTQTATSSPTPEISRNVIVVAIDEIGLGFNPHLLAHQSPVNAAVGSMVLPSPFRPQPVPDVPGASVWVLDENLLVSADVRHDGTGAEPFTVTYVLRNEAQWSDGAPIAAEDFHYLWRQMVTQPGVVDPAGYELIQDVRSSAGGKTVTVTFSSPYPAWRELFSNLLPAHLIKDTPGGFDQGLADTIPVSGGHFHIESVDRGRDEILLERNDRYWGPPTIPDQILLRRGGTPAQVAESLRTSDAQLASVHGGVALQAQLSAIGGVRTGREYQPRVLQLSLNARVAALRDAEVRNAVLALLDPATLATVGSGSSGTAAAEALIRSPSDPGYAPTAPPRMRYDDAMAVFAARGYVLSDGLLTRGSRTDEEPFELVIGVPTGDSTALAVASTAADQLNLAGVQASVRPMIPSDLYGRALVGGEIDAVVGWMRAGSDLATAVASRWRCPHAGAGPQPPTASSLPRTVPPSTTAGATPNPDDPTPDRETLLAPSNLSGACDPTIQDEIEDALRGVRTIDAVDDVVEPRLWALGAVLPIFQDTTQVAVSDDVEGVSLQGPVPVGVFYDAAQWSRVAQ